MGPGATTRSPTAAVPSTPSSATPTAAAADPAAREALRRSLPELPAPGSTLQIVENGPRQGVNRKHVLQDEAGRRYFWKAQDAAGFALQRTLLAQALRGRAGEAVVPVRPHDLTVAGQTTQGLLAPFVASTGSLDYAVRTFTPAERHAVLADLPWAFFLGNWDTKPDQYLRVHGTAVNIDWDQALSDFGRAQPRYDRHTRAHFSPLIPPVQAALLLEWVHGRTDANLDVVRDSAARIARLTDEDLQQAAQPLVDAAFGDGGAGLPGLRDPAAVWAALQGRRDRVVDETDRLLEALRVERARHGRPLAALDVRLLAGRAEDASLRAAIAVARSPLVEWLYAARQAVGSLRRPHPDDDVGPVGTSPATSSSAS